jgi:hypothetical protein
LNGFIFQWINDSNMGFTRKGQVGAITVVLLTGITIGVASVVYVWGEPILDKRESATGLDSVERKVVELRQELVRVSEAGEGASSQVDISVENEDYGFQLVSLNASSDYIDLVVDADDSPYPENEWTMLRGDNFQNLSITGGDYAIQGRDLGSVLLVKPEGSVIIYRIEFRNLYSEGESDTALRKVDLQSEGSTVGSGGAELYMRTAGDELDQGSEGLTISTGETLNRRRTELEVDIR